VLGNWHPYRDQAAFQAARLALFLRACKLPSHNNSVRRSERRLPHWDAVEQPLFVTFRLYGTLPANRTFLPGVLADAGKAFVAMDRILDSAASGPSYLRMPEIAALVADALRTGESRFSRYQLHAYVVMPNHVHMLVTPHVVAPRWLGPLKGFTAHEANGILGLHGRHFWQDESYDRLVRSDCEFYRIRNYIEQNPVKAGLVAAAQRFQWSSAYEEEAA